MSCLYMERATRLELATVHPTNGVPPFAGTPDDLLIENRLTAQVKVASSCAKPKKQDTQTDVLLCYMERATRLELATSTLGRWRSTR